MGLISPLWPQAVLQGGLRCWGREPLPFHSNWTWTTSSCPDSLVSNSPAWQPRYSGLCPVSLAAREVDEAGRVAGSFLVFVKVLSPQLLSLGRRVPWQGSGVWGLLYSSGQATSPRSVKQFSLLWPWQHLNHTKLITPLSLVVNQAVSPRPR